MRPAAAVLIISAALALAAPAMAGTTAPGVNLRWDQCFGNGGASNKTFACDTNAGTERLVATFELASALSDVTQVDLYLDLATPNSTIPSWWHYRNTGSCRQASLQILLPGVASCADWANGAGVGGIGSYTLNAHGIANHSRIAAAIGVPPGSFATLDPGVEYHAMSFTINHAKTVGAGSCAGCLDPVCICLSRAQIWTNNAPTPLLLNSGANGPASQYATWQSGQPTNVSIACDPPPETCTFKYIAFDCALSPTPARNLTWGAVKSLYR